MRGVVLLALLCCIMSAPAKNWAVLVAGSSGYYNYRHQSDVFHAYHILTKNGIPADNIIVMAYDDIANNRQNPTPGKMCNKPNGDDVYQGVPIDYKARDVSAKNFLAIIKGDKSGVTGGNGRVVESTSEDNVFIYYTDHGADNMVAFPVGSLYAKDLNAALDYMYENKKYAKLVFYLEACYSGSMFEKYLSAEKNIYATTAANSHESSYAHYCGNEALCGGKRTGSCLGDEYSVKWMEDSDKVDLWTTTLGEQFETVKSQTKGSHVMEFGDLNMKPEVLGLYQGHKNSKWNKFLHFVENQKVMRKNEEDESERVANVDHYLYYLRERAEMTNDVVDWETYRNEVSLANRSRRIFEAFRRKFDLPEERNSPDVNTDCLKNTLHHYNQVCGFNIERDAKYVTHLASFCTLNKSTWEAYHAFREICH